MNLKKYFVKSKMLIVSVLAIGSMLALAASPVFAAGPTTTPSPVPANPAPSRLDREGPLQVKPIALNASTETLAAMFHRDTDLARMLKADILQARGLNEDFTHVLNSKNHTLKITTADFRGYQGDIKRAADDSTDLSALIASHTGFNKDGDVTNAAQARATLNMMNVEVDNGLYWARHALDAFADAQVNHLN
ncbi:MAG TPA: hypothetical protein VGK00_11910 [Anaerolineales bacterium]|jgi:hypothetical protein